MTDERIELRRDLNGWITHTDISSSDPDATREWCASVLGWTFLAPLPGAEGEEPYYLFTYSDAGGGGIGRTPPGEQPGSIPTVQVADVQQAYDAALAAGAEVVNPPNKVMEGVTVAIVRAPGGVLIGLSGPST